MANPTGSRRAVPAHAAEHEDDDHGQQRGYVRGTDFALPYFSPWSRLHDAVVKDGLLRHVNCGYLSTHGVAPTLLALKQHAQSLCVLIHQLNPTLRSAEILGGDPSRAPGGIERPARRGRSLTRGRHQQDPVAFKHELSTAFDFLADLSVPYANDDPNHHKPLTGLLNDVSGRDEARGTTTYHCPLARCDGYPARRKGQPPRPYASHHALVMHANACLERLDHEFSSTGGLMSLLPTSSSAEHEHEAADLASARQSLLGQWLLFTQHLVARMHELEISYGNALDALAGEAAVPAQVLASVGAEGRATGREVGFPQDRWVLVNAGDDVFGHVHDMLDRQEALMQAREAVWRRNGAVGDRIWEKERGGKDYARGMVPVTLATRYYRLAGGGRDSALFVLPAWEHHPGVAATRQAEKQPTVVVCPQPKLAMRATALERRYDEQISRAKKVDKENGRLKGEIEELRDENEAKRSQIETLQRENKHLAKKSDGLALAVGQNHHELAAQVHRERSKALRYKDEVVEAQRERDAAVQKVERLQTDIMLLKLEMSRMRGEA